MELLVVIAIVAALATLAYGPIMKFIGSGDITADTKTAKDLQLAIQQYNDKYRYLPYDGSVPSEDEAYDTDSGKGISIIKTLMGDNSSGANPSKRRFFTAEHAKDGIKGIVYEGDNPKSLIDSFGKPFKFALAYGDDDFVDVSKISGSYGDPSDLKITEKSAVAGGGPDQEFNDKEDVKTW